MTPKPQIKAPDCASHNDHFVEEGRLGPNFLGRRTASSCALDPSHLCAGTSSACSVPARTAAYTSSPMLPLFPSADARSSASLPGEAVETDVEWGWRKIAVVSNRRWSSRVMTPSVRRPTEWWIKKADRNPTLMRRGWHGNCVLLLLMLVSLEGSAAAPARRSSAFAGYFVIAAALASGGVGCDSTIVGDDVDSISSVPESLWSE